MFKRFSAWMHASDIRAYPLYSATIFLSAFLLFQVQPMIARFLLPFFGGAVSVWAASLAFFTSTLFLGYVYVYAISTLSVKRQTFIHALLLGGAAGSIALIFFTTGTAYPSFAWVFDVTHAPALQVLLALAVCIGIPYFLLSTTGPLLQHWYAGASGREPYHLYALSNSGSLLALATYPFVTEKFLGLSAQQVVWSFFFLVCVALLGTVVFSFRRTRIEPHHERVEDIRAIPYTRLASWLLLAAIPAAMLVATTTRITQVITPVPFLWVVPLALYLLSFVFAFRGWGQRGLLPFSLIIAAFASYTYLDWSYATTGRQIAANLALFFLGALLCHALLYKTRPAARLSSFYYVWISLGGALGTLAVALVAPVVFVSVAEFSLGLVALALIAIASYPAAFYIRDEYLRRVRMLKVLGVIGIFILSLHYAIAHESYALYASRNFYGVAQVYDYGETRSLYHGSTMHGTQFLVEEKAGIPTSYYSLMSGVGRAIIDVQTEAGTQPINVGMVGLGTGTIAAYCREGDAFTFYEIDPRIGAIATSLFSYLSRCAGAEVRYGDGRLLLAEEFKAGTRGQYDVLAIDAFSDDTIPVHLLTKEAVTLFLTHLRDDNSILAIHTSNRFFKLAPIVVRIAHELGLASAVINNDGALTEGASSSQWVLLTKNPAVLQRPLFTDGVGHVADNAPLWTDDYADVFAALDLQGLRLWSSQ